MREEAQIRKDLARTEEQLLDSVDTDEAKDLAERMGVLMKELDEVLKK